MINSILTTEKTTRQKELIYGLSEEKLNLLNSFYALMKNRNTVKCKKIDFANESQLEKYASRHRLLIRKACEDEYINEITEYFKF